MPTVNMRPFEYVDALIEAYANTHSHSLRWPQEMRTEAKRLSSGNLWFLAYALEGYAVLDGQREPVQWLREGIRHDLNSLQNCGDPEQDWYPYVLVALSRLYRYEVQTAENYLVDQLGFPMVALKALARRGQITSETHVCGSILYGLHHSSHAQAYWVHGAGFRKGITDEHEFVTDYAVRGSPNGLQAITRSCVVSVVSHELAEKGLLSEVIGRERSDSAIVLWCHRLIMIGRLRDDVLSVMAQKLCEVACVDTMLVEIFNREWEDYGSLLKLWRIIDHVRLADRLLDLEDPADIAVAISILRRANAQAGDKIWALLDGKFAERLVHADSLCDMVSSLWYFVSNSAELASRLCSLLDVKALAARITMESNTAAVVKLFCAVCYCDKTFGEMLWSVTDHLGIARRIGLIADAYEICLDAKALFQASSRIGAELWHAMDHDALIRRIDATADITIWLHCVRYLVEADADVSRWVWDRIRKRDLSAIDDSFITPDFQELMLISRTDTAMGHDLIDLIHDTRKRRKVIRTLEKLSISVDT